MTGDAMVAAAVTAAAGIAVQLAVGAYGAGKLSGVFEAKMRSIEGWVGAVVKDVDGVKKDVKDHETRLSKVEERVKVNSAC